VTVIVIVGLFAAAVAYLRWGVTPPDVNTDRRRPSNIQGGSDSGNIVAGAQDPDLPGIPEARNTRKFTFLVLGTDDSDALTDVIMAASFDADSYTLNVVNIPRDTLVNVSWNVRKANSILPNSLIQTRGQEENRQERTMELTIDHFANILGFEVDFYIRVDMRAFIRLVDSIDGVEFNIPRTMSHEEFAQTYRPGLQHLSGRQALDIVRFRGFADGDIGRISTQQDFLTAAVQQILARSDSIRYRDLISIFLNYVETDLTVGNLIYLSRAFLRMDAENVHFETMPGNYNDRINGLSYVTIYVDEWLELLNERLNPFEDDIMREELSILTRGADRRLIVTDGNFSGNPQWGQPGRASAPPSGGTPPPPPSNNRPTEPPPPTDAPGDTDPDGVDPDDPDDPPDTVDPTEPAEPTLGGDGPDEPPPDVNEPGTAPPEEPATEPPSPPPLPNSDEQDAA